MIHHALNHTFALLCAYIVHYAAVADWFHAWGGWADPAAWIVFFGPHTWLWRPCTYKDLSPRYRNLASEAFRECP